MLIRPENADQLKLEIWREIIRSKGEWIPSSGMMSVSQGSYTQPPDPVAAATKALNTFNTLYPAPVSVTKKRKSR